ncbi:unnamed protein product [Adineta ricciae]|uniref:Uncharacterized protein n=1 Tax=Adineta ricciae TaxID=249248 RepID=A0A813WU99_ADIRI|nr:unnamed protein product [Adineta ricciae]CAF1169915.1 unnamed protein product [Adineta ricciae]
MSNRSMDEEIERIFNGKIEITKEKLKQTLEELLNKYNSLRRSHSAIHRAAPLHNEMKQEPNQLLESELDKITSNTISKEHAKSILSALRTQMKDQWHAHIDSYIQTSIKDEMKKLNVHEVNVSQAHDLLRTICHRMKPSHDGTPAVLDDSVKNDFLNEFKSKHGSNKISAEEVWEIVKDFDKKQHDKMGCCEKNSQWDSQREKKWDEIFHEQYKELFGEKNNSKVNEQQLEELAKRLKEKFQQECPQHPGKRFCQH